jgi:hypothetical protein
MQQHAKEQVNTAPAISRFSSGGFFTHVSTRISVQFLGLMPGVCRLALHHTAAALTSQRGL